MPTVNAPPTVCTCGNTTFYDNRKDKTNPKSPDFRCRECKEGYWLKGGPGADAEPGPTPAARRQPMVSAPLPVSSAQQEYGAVPAQTVVVPPQLTFETIKAKHQECIMASLALVTTIEGFGVPVGSDPSAVVAMAHVMFIERMKRGV